MTPRPSRDAVRGPVIVKRLEGPWGYCRKCLRKPVWFVDSGLPTGRSIRTYCDEHLPPKHRAAADRAS